MPKKKDSSQNILAHIDSMLVKQNSLKRIFLQGLVRGLGTAIGATVLLALITSIAIQFTQAIDYDKAASYFFNSAISD